MIRKGDIILVTFFDHAEGTDHFEFTTYGRVLSQSKLSIVICGWHYSDLKKAASVDDSNVIVHTILKSTITKIKRLVAI